MGILIKPFSVDEPVIITATSILLRVKKWYKAAIVWTCILHGTSMYCYVNYWQAYVTMSWACNSISKCCTKLLALSTFSRTWETGQKCVSMIQWK